MKGFIDKYGISLLTAIGEHIVYVIISVAIDEANRRRQN